MHGQCYRFLVYGGRYTGIGLATIYAYGYIGLYVLPAPTKRETKNFSYNVQYVYEYSMYSICMYSICTVYVQYMSVQYKYVLYVFTVRYM